MLAACDTFRAAAIDQLKLWGERLGVDVVAGAYGADPAAIAMFCVLRATSIVSARLHLQTSRPLWATSIVSATLPLPTSRPLLTAALVASIVIAMPPLPSLLTAPVDAAPTLFVASMVMATPPLPIASPLLVTRVIVLAAVEAALLASP